MKNTMAMIQSLVRALLLASLLGSATVSNAADIQAGASKAKEVCQACHGMDGNSTVPDYPKLAGQRPDYLAKALRDYKSGARKNAIMAGFAGTLSTADIENVAAYYSAQAPVLYVKGH
jgi:cytochrome c553